MKQVDRDRVDRAVDHINLLLQAGFLEHGEAWIKAWYRFDLKWSDDEPGYVTLPSDKITALVHSGMDDAEVFDLVCFVAGTRISAGAPLPDELTSFAGNVLQGKSERPRRKRGRPSEWGRNFIIIRAMIEVNPGILFEGEDALHPTASLDQRGVRSRELSAMEIICEALQKTRIGFVDKKSINEIWTSKKWQNAHNEAYGLYLGNQLDDLDEVIRV